MPSIFKYVGAESYARALIEKGQLYLQSLAHFRAYEDGLVRGDPDDGKLRYQPAEGLTLTKADGEVVVLPAGSRFRSSVNAEDVFVYCLSSERSEALAEKFRSPFCVEIRDAGALFAKIKGSVKLRSKLDSRNVYRGAVEYRALSALPGGDWALPEKVAFIKPPDWSWQAEYRIVIGRKGTFRAENVSLALEIGPGESSVAMQREPLVLNVGSLSPIAQLHRF
ncbi:hypothetical protein [Caulobacter sp. X]|uniref:hypothetical protein n=1 Tax=Caulobacter sp. X TaxID=2048901 RepID=UPI000C149DF5|nr:hypothetical protein [Caulobacter sp. X]PIC01708.1 hypothetical protein CSW60_09550 [Caulobacter sp. X]